jgi:hypothetical protein
MKNFDVQSISIATTLTNAFSYISNPDTLPEWTNAFKKASNTSATLQTPNGEVDISLEVKSSNESYTIDWYMQFPDGSLATAFSRLIPITENQCIYSFVLTPPPVPLEQLEGTLEMQSQILAKELLNLKEILERG